MELYLNIYKTKLCREVEKTVTANEFELSVGVCEDVVNMINIDMFEGGLEGLSNEAILEIAIPIIRNGFPFFKELLSEIFEVSPDEIRRTKISEVAQCIVAIVKYSISQLKSLVGKKTKN